MLPETLVRIYETPSATLMLLTIERALIWLYTLVNDVQSPQTFFRGNMILATERAPKRYRPLRSRYTHIYVALLNSKSGGRREGLWLSKADAHVPRQPYSNSRPRSRRETVWLSNAGAHVSDWPCSSTEHAANESEGVGTRCGKSFRITFLIIKHPNNTRTVSPN